MAIEFVLFLVLKVRKMNLLKYFEHVEKSDNRETHVWMGPVCRKMFLPQQYRDSFYSAYNQMLFYGASSGASSDANRVSAPLYIAEKPRKSSDTGPTYVPLVVDIDLNCSMDEVFDDGLKLYSEADAEQVIKCFHRVLENCLLNPKHHLFTCFLLEKPPKACKNRWKNGFHIHYPFAQFAARSIKETIFPAVKIEMDSFCYADGRRLFGMDKPSITLDSNTPTLPWLMYGSKKDDSSDPYLYTQIYDRDMCKISLQSVVHMETFETVEGEKINFEGCEQNALIRLLSVDTVFVSRKSLKTKPKLKRAVLAGPPVSYGPFSSLDATVEENFNRVKQLVEVLSAARASSYDTWWNVMITIFNVTGGSEEGYQTWKSFSEKAGHLFDEQATLKCWKDAATRPRHSTLRTRHFGSLVQWAREDDPEAVEHIYNQWKSASHNILIYNTDWKIATHFFEKYKEKYVFHDKLWYQYNGIIWEPLNDPLTRMRKDIVDLSKEWDRNELNETDQKRYQNLVKKLEGSDQSSIMNQATTIFEVKDFGKLLDSDPSIIAFENGVYDMEKMIFRKSSPYMDYLSKNLPIPYQTFDRHDPAVSKLETFFEKLFPRDELRTYFLTQLAEIFWGANRDKVAMFWIGTGNNGKSVMQILLEKMLGNFSRKLPTTVLTSKRPQQGGATPEIATLKGVRWVMMEEFNSQEEIEVGTLKQLTGNDTLSARHLYGSQFEFVPAFKLAVASNSFPKLRNPDEATWNRVRVIPFESCFVESSKAPKTFEEQKRLKRFPKNSNITSEFGDMAITLAWYLLELFKQTEEQRRKNPSWEMPLPDIVVSEKEKYKKNCNRIQQFADQVMIVCESSDREKDSDVMYTLFKEWWCSNVNPRPPPKSDFDAEMTRIGICDNIFYKLKPVLL